MGSHCRALCINRHSFHSRTDEIEIEFFFFVFSRLREKIGPKHLCSSLVLLRLHHLMHRIRLTCVSHSPRARFIRKRPLTLLFTIAGQIHVSALSERWKSAKQTFGDDSRVKTHKRNKKYFFKTQKIKNPTIGLSRQLASRPLLSTTEKRLNYIFVLFFCTKRFGFRRWKCFYTKEVHVYEKALSRCFHGMSKQVSALLLRRVDLLFSSKLSADARLGLWNCARSLWKRFSLNVQATISDLKRW